MSKIDTFIPKYFATFEGKSMSIKSNNEKAAGII